MSYTFSGIDHVQLAAPEGCEPKARSFFVVVGLGRNTETRKLKKAWVCMVPMRHPPGTHRSPKDIVPATKAHSAFHVGNTNNIDLS
jgi:hypothetical protein